MISKSVATKHAQIFGGNKFHLAKLMNIFYDY